MDVPEARILNNSMENADIQVKDDTFDITVEECIKVLNEDIKKENLDLIPGEYKTVELHDWTDYRCMINDILMIRFVTYKNHGPGIVRIALLRIDSIAYKKGNMNFNYEATKQDRKMAETYCEIICNNVKPKFNADRFVKPTEGNTSDMELDLGGMFFSAICQTLIPCIEMRILRYMKSLALISYMKCIEKTCMMMTICFCIIDSEPFYSFMKISLQIMRIY